jgi:hypothetical protein
LLRPEPPNPTRPHPHAWSGWGEAPLGLPGDAIPTVNLFIVACLLWATVKIPSLLSKYATRSGGRTPGAYLIRVVVLQQLARAARLPIRIP